MAARFAPILWPMRLRLVVGAVVVIALTQAVRSGGEDQHDLPVLAPQQPIARADARLLADGWIPKPDREPLPYERERAANNLASLSGCSGTGVGFCRYDYQRAGQRFAVVTVPGPDGHGIVHTTFELE